MSKFQELSFLRFFLRTVCTFGIYALIWALSTKRALNRAGAAIPSGFYMILPVVNIYFWYKYAQAYVAIVKKSTRDQDVLFYFFVPMLSQSVIALSFNNWIAILDKSLVTIEILVGSISAGVVHLLLMVFFILITFFYWTAVNYLFYQKGFNEFIESEDHDQFKY